MPFSPWREVSLRRPSGERATPSPEETLQPRQFNDLLGSVGSSGALGQDSDNSESDVSVRTPSVGESDPTRAPSRDHVIPDGCFPIVKQDGAYTSCHDPGASPCHAQPYCERHTLLKL